jgi:predicted HicB family RNase H-like nuclease
MAEKSKIIAVKVSPELWANVREKADRKSVSVSGLLRRSLEQWVEA